MKNPSFSPMSSPNKPITLARMTPQDTEAYLNIFELKGLAMWLAQGLVGFLNKAVMTRESQLVAQSLPPKNQLNYLTVRRAVLEQVD